MKLNKLGTVLIASSIGVGVIDSNNHYFRKALLDNLAGINTNESSEYYISPGDVGIKVSEICNDFESKDSLTYKYSNFCIEGGMEDETKITEEFFNSNSLEFWLTNLDEGNNKQVIEHAIPNGWIKADDITEDFFDVFSLNSFIELRGVGENEAIIFKVVTQGLIKIENITKDLYQELGFDFLEELIYKGNGKSGRQFILVQAFLNGWIDDSDVGEKFFNFVSLKNWINNQDVGNNKKIIEKGFAEGWVKASDIDENFNFEEFGELLSNIDKGDNRKIIEKAIKEKRIEVNESNVNELLTNGLPLSNDKMIDFFKKGLIKLESINEKLYQSYEYRIMDNISKGNNGEILKHAINEGWETLISFNDIPNELELLYFLLESGSISKKGFSIYDTYNYTTTEKIKIFGWDTIGRKEVNHSGYKSFQYRIDEILDGGKFVITSQLLNNIFKNREKLKYRFSESFAKHFDKMRLKGGGEIFNGYINTTYTEKEWLINIFDYLIKGYGIDKDSCSSLDKRTLVKLANDSSHRKVYAQLVNNGCIKSDHINDSYVKNGGELDDHYDELLVNIINMKESKDFLRQLHESKHLSDFLNGIDKKIFIDTNNSRIILNAMILGGFLPQSDVIGYIKDGTVKSENIPLVVESLIQFSNISVEEVIDLVTAGVFKSELMPSIVISFTKRSNKSESAVIKLVESGLLRPFDINKTVFEYLGSEYWLESNNDYVLTKAISNGWIEKYDFFRIGIDTMVSHKMRFALTLAYNKNWFGSIDFKSVPLQEWVDAGLDEIVNSLSTKTERDKIEPIDWVVNGMDKSGAYEIFNDRKIFESVDLSLYIENGMDYTIRNALSKNFINIDTLRADGVELENMVENSMDSTVEWLLSEGTIAGVDVTKIPNEKWIENEMHKSIMVGNQRGYLKIGNYKPVSNNQSVQNHNSISEKVGYDFGIIDVISLVPQVRGLRLGKFALSFVAKAVVRGKRPTAKDAVIDYTVDYVIDKTIK